MAALFGGAQLVTETLTFSQTWTAPGTFSVNLIGKGQDGTAFTPISTFRRIFNISYRTDANQGTGNVTWDNFSAPMMAAVADLNSDGMANWTDFDIDVWPDGRNRINQQNSVTVSDAIPGTAGLSSNMGVSGPIAFSGSAVINYAYYGPGQPGAAAAGFGMSFPGGAVGQPAPVTTLNDVTVKPGQQFDIVIPQGGSITISYYL